MKLTYRGVSYDYTPPKVEYGPIYARGKYRGAPVAFESLKEIPVEQPSYNLKYRGVSYTSGVGIPMKNTTNNSEGVEAAPATPPVPEAKPAAAPAMSVLERARALMMGHHQMVRRREQSMLARLDEEVGLTAKDAAEYESHIQGKIRHNFWKSYDRSKSAMS